MLSWLLAYAAATYVVDVLARPADAAHLARAAADRRQKPLLNVGAGTARTSLRAALFGPTLWGDVNVDLAGSGLHGPNNVSFGDVHRLPFADRTFGAAIASHVLEHVDDPALALAELRRVADEVFVVVPSWWAPHTWAHPGHRWFVRADGAAVPLWQQRMTRAGDRP